VKYILARLKLNTFCIHKKVNVQFVVEKSTKYKNVSLGVEASKSRWKAGIIYPWAG